MSRAKLLGSSLLAVSLLSGTPARAAVTADQATALEAQLRTWFASVLGAKVDLSGVPFHVRADGDEYRLEMPIANLAPITGTGPASMTITGGPFTSHVHPLDGGRWAIDDWNLPSPDKITVVGADGKTVNVSLSFDSQTATGVFDPSLATPSQLDGKQTGVKETFDFAGGHGSATMARATWHNTMGAKTPDGVALTADAVLEGYATTLPGKPAKAGEPAQNVLLAIDKVTASSKLAGLDLDQLGTMLRLVSSAAAQGAAKNAAATMQKPAPGAAARKAATEMTADERAMAHALVHSIASLMTSFDGSQSLEGLNVQAAGHSVQIGTFAIGGGFGAPQGKVDVHLRMAIDGLASPDIPPGPYQGFVPRHIVLAPRVAGLPKSGLVALIDKAIDSQGKDDAGMQADAMALLDDGKLTLGIDQLTLDIGTAKLSGVGSVEVQSPTEISGAAELHMTGLDALIKQINATPPLKQAAPVLIFLKGIGEQKGDDTVWVVKYVDNKVTVNDTDMSSMIPGSK